MNYKVKIILGFRQDQVVLIPIEEAHKAYYLFTHPNERGVFDNGYAIRGSDIQRIDPDYTSAMGWNEDYVPDSFDMIEVRRVKADKELRDLMQSASQIAKLENPPINLPLSKAIEIQNNIRILTI